ncbi:ATP-binding cassette domain-containing protein [Flavitalea sp. BT771]|uniref:ABC transporter ATP-binding protein n=1 Tax=Flavitalea sp. BT771 TaxID=3063329 RepID=UPI0026E33B25|nr:ATP-binding cassette domain-containing protein [Flavitalea sp. BT771]MDO6429502.1 ATP-binding cassette domain-containing protein [Flavitalea sp. BT771]MDV6218370.1 ATP-binding cassette domain-containing protein [Flavitalea sp. BT771]
METATQHITTKSDPAEQTPVIFIEHVCKRFGDNVVLNDFGMTVEKGENVVVLGRSGVGKSVLIKCIVGLLKADSGNIVVLDKDITSLDHDEMDKMRARVGFLFQSNALYDSMTVRKNLEFPLRRHWIESSRDEIDAMVLEALENVGLAHTIDMMPEELSGGMKKRVALARTLILKPEIILYDEPTTGLDPVTGKEISMLIVELQAKYRTSSIIISHDMHCVKLTASKIVLLMDGKNYCSGTYEALSRSTDPAVKQFFE